MANNGKIFVTCAHCGAGGTYNSSIQTGDGGLTIQCNSCRKSTYAELRKGDIHRTRQA
jgi:transcription elongation factor Elf1